MWEFHQFWLFAISKSISNFILSWVETEQKFYNLGARDQKGYWIAEATIKLWTVCLVERLFKWPSIIQWKHSTRLLGFWMCSSNRNQLALQKQLKLAESLHWHYCWKSKTDAQLFILERREKYRTKDQAQANYQTKPDIWPMHRLHDCLYQKQKQNKILIEKFESVTENLIAVSMYEGKFKWSCQNHSITKRKMSKNKQQ